MTTYIFPGQGAQSIGMGKELFDEFPNITASADRILGYSIKDLCLYDSEHKLNNTEYTQPALYIVNILNYLKKLKDGVRPDYTAGHSLGEYCALYIAGAFSFEDGLRLVIKRGQLMGRAKNGGMAAVIGLKEEKVKKILKESEYRDVSISNYNSPEQFVLSGTTNDIRNSASLFEDEGARYILLNVSGAFHSKFMEEAKEEFEKYIRQFEFSHLNIPVISTCTARPYTDDNIHENLVNQIVGGVKWIDTIRFLRDLGEENIIEIGPKKTLTKLVQKINEAYDKEKVEEKNSYNIKSVAEDVEKEVKRLKGQVNLFWNKELKKYKEYGLRDNLSVVEFGCGPGYLTEKILNEFKNIKVTGVELDPYLVEVAKKNLYKENLDRVKVVRGNITKCDIESNKFDIAIIRLVLEHLIDPVIALKEVYRVLKPGGKVIVIDNDFEMHIRSYPHIPELKELYDAYCRKRESEGGRPMIGRELPALLRNADFKNIDFDIINAHNQIIGDDPFSESEGLGIPIKLVRDGFLDSKVLAGITVKWNKLMQTKDHVILRQLYIAVGEK